MPRGSWKKAGLSPAARDIFSDSLVQADLRGISSHGVTHLAAYAKRVELGLVDGFAVPELLADGGSLLSVDGKTGWEPMWAPGPWTCASSAPGAWELLRGGIPLQPFRLCRLFHRAGGGGRDAGPGHRQRSQGPASHRGAPPSGDQSPGGEPAHRSGRTAPHPGYGHQRCGPGQGHPGPQDRTGHPSGLGVDKDGNPATDPNAVLSGGAMLPVGGPKGYAIALIIECLCSCLTGSDNGQTMGELYDMERVQNTGFALRPLT